MHIYKCTCMYVLSLTTRNVKKILCIGTFKSSVLHRKRAGVRRRYYNGVTRRLLLFARAVDDDHACLWKRHSSAFEVGKRKKRKWLVISVRFAYILVRFFIILRTDDVLIRRCIIVNVYTRRCVGGRGFRTTSWPISFLYDNIETFYETNLDTFNRLICMCIRYDNNMRIRRWSSQDDGYPPSLPAPRRRWLSLKCRQLTAGAYQRFVFTVWGATVFGRVRQKIVSIAPYKYNVTSSACLPLYPSGETIRDDYTDNLYLLTR